MLVLWSNYRGRFLEKCLDLFAATGADFTVHWIVLGMAAYFVAVVRAPITGVILILEMTGSFHLLLALTTVSVVSFYVTELLGQQPVYDILYDRMKKDDNLVDEENQEKVTIELPVMAESFIGWKGNFRNYLARRSINNCNNKKWS